MHHDGMHFFPIDGSSDDGLLVVNHEYIEPRFLHAEADAIALLREFTDAQGHTTRAAALAMGGDWHDLGGDLTEGVAARVARLLGAHPGIARLHLTSDGGLVEEGSAIGALVAARGLDLPDLGLVIHAELPVNRATLLHRSGRTGRASRAWLRS